MTVGWKLREHEGALPRIEPSELKLEGTQPLAADSWLFPERPVNRVSGRDQAAPPHEVELKLEIAPEDAPKLRHDRRFKAQGESRRQESVYYDTPKQTLRRAGYTLRVRRTGDAFVQTIKATGKSVGLFDRPEWETSVSGPGPDADALKLAPFADFPKRKLKLISVVTSRVERTSWLVRHASSDIEVVHDEGTISAGGQQLPLHELELELKSGSPAALFGLARSIGKYAPLKIGVLSKAERGFALAAGDLGGVHKASAVNVDRSMNGSEAFAAIVHDCIRHFRLNEQAIAERRDPLALHQARVAVRRLRSSLSLFAPMVRDLSLGPLREELRWFGNVLGNARNLDVFHKNYQPALSPSQQETVQSARTQAYDQVEAAIGSERLRELLLDLLAWLAMGEWRDGRRASARIKAFSAKRLDRFWRKVEADATQLKRLDEEQLHRLRIDIKKLRYAVEFLGSIYRREDVKPFASSLEAMQEHLGELNDETTANQIMEHLSLGDCGKIDGTGAIADRSAQLASLGKQFARLERRRRFWA